MTKEYLYDKTLEEQEKYLNNIIENLNNGVKNKTIEVQGKGELGGNTRSFTTDTHGDLVSVMGAQVICGVKFAKNKFLYYDKEKGIYYEKVVSKDGKTTIWYECEVPYKGEKGRKGEINEKDINKNNLMVVPIPDTLNARDLYHLGDILDRGKESLTSLLLCEISDNMKLVIGDHEFDTAINSKYIGNHKEISSINKALARMKHNGRMKMGYWDGNGNDVISYSHVDTSEADVISFFEFMNSVYRTSKYSDKVPPIIEYLDKEFEKENKNLAIKIKAFLNTYYDNIITSNKDNADNIFKELRNYFTIEEMLMVKNAISGALIERQIGVGKNNEITCINGSFDSFSEFDELNPYGENKFNFYRKERDKPICSALKGHDVTHNKTEKNGVEAEEKNGKTVLGIDDGKGYVALKGGETIITVSNVNIAGENIGNEDGKNANITSSSYTVERAKDGIKDTFTKNTSEGYGNKEIKNFGLKKIEKKELDNSFYKIIKGVEDDPKKAFDECKNEKEKIFALNAFLSNCSDIEQIKKFFNSEDIQKFIGNKKEESEPSDNTINNNVELKNNLIKSVFLNPKIIEAVANGDFSLLKSICGSNFKEYYDSNFETKYKDKYIECEGENDIYLLNCLLSNQKIIDNILKGSYSALDAVCGKKFEDFFKTNEHKEFVVNTILSKIKTTEEIEKFYKLELFKNAIKEHKDIYIVLNNEDLTNFFIDNDLLNDENYKELLDNAIDNYRIKTIRKVFDKFKNTGKEFPNIFNDSATFTAFLKNIMNSKNKEIKEIFLNSKEFMKSVTNNIVSKKEDFIKMFCQNLKQNTSEEDIEFLASFFNNLVKISTEKENIVKLKKENSKKDKTVGEFLSSEYYRGYGIANYNITLVVIDKLYKDYGIEIKDSKGNKYETIRELIEEKNKGKISSEKLEKIIGEKLNECLVRISETEKFKNEVESEKSTAVEVAPAADVESTKTTVPDDLAAHMLTTSLVIPMKEGEELNGLTEEEINSIKVFSENGEINPVNITNYAFTLFDNNSTKKRAIELYKIAADMGNQDAILKYAKILENGDGIPKDKEMALEYYYKVKNKTKEISNKIDKFDKKIVKIKNSELSASYSKKEKNSIKKILEAAGYENLEELGKGGFGSVFKTKDGRAIKISEANGEDFNTEKKNSFEINSLGGGFGKTLESRRIKLTNDSGTATYFLIEISKERVMDLHTMIRKKSNGEDDEIAKNFSPIAGAIQLVNALEKAHLDGLILADIKPENILINEKGICKLADFGLTKKAREYIGNYNKGTPGYKSPEIDSEGRITQKADVYALGATLYQMLTGKDIFEGKENSRKIDPDKIKLEDIDLSKLYPGVNFGENKEEIEKKFFNLVKSMINENIDQRPTIFEVKEQLAQITEYISKICGVNLEENLKIRKKDSYNLGVTSKDNIKDTKNRYTKELDLLITYSKLENEEDRKNEKNNSTHLQAVLGDDIDKFSDNAIACLETLKNYVNNNYRIENPDDFKKLFDGIENKRERIIIIKRLFDLEKLQLAEAGRRLENLNRKTLMSVIDKDPSMIEHLFALKLENEERDNLKTKEEWLNKLKDKAGENEFVKAFLKSVEEEKTAPVPVVDDGGDKKIDVVPPAEPEPEPKTTASNLFDKFIYKQLEKATEDDNYKNICVDKTLEKAKSILFKDSKVPEGFKEICDKYFKVFLINNPKTRVVARRLYDFYYLYEQSIKFKENGFKDIPQGAIPKEYNGDGNSIDTNAFNDTSVSAISTDLHGSMNAALFFLLDSGVAKFRKDTPTFVYYDMVSRKAYNSIEEFLTENKDATIEKAGFLKLIPNLEINKDYEGKAVNCGDLIDRGSYSDEIVSMFSYLEEQEKGVGPNNKKIIRICGNHELGSYSDDLTAKISDGREFIYRDILEDRIRLYYADGGVLYSHTMPLASDLKNGIKYIEKFKTNYPEAFKELFKDFNDGEFTKLKEEIENISKDKSKTLSPECTNLLPKYFNPLLKIYSIKKLKESENHEINMDPLKENYSKCFEELIFAEDIEDSKEGTVEYKVGNLDNIIQPDDPAVGLSGNRDLGTPICNCIFGHTPMRGSIAVYRNKNIIALDADNGQTENKFLKGDEAKTNAFYIKLEGEKENKKPKAVTCRMDVGKDFYDFNKKNNNLIINNKTFKNDISPTINQAEAQKEQKARLERIQADKAKDTVEDAITTIPEPKPTAPAAVPAPAPASEMTKEEKENLVIQIKKYMEDGEGDLEDIVNRSVELDRDTLLNVRKFREKNKEKEQKFNERKVIFFKNLANKGNHNAMNFYGFILENGNFDSPIDKTKAVKYYEMAADKGNEKAKNNLEKLKKSLEESRPKIQEEINTKTEILKNNAQKVNDEIECLKKESLIYHITDTHGDSLSVAGALKQSGFITAVSEKVLYYDVERDEFLDKLPSADGMTWEDFKGRYTIINDFDVPNFDSIPKGTLVHTGDMQDRGAEGPESFAIMRLLMEKYEKLYIDSHTGEPNLEENAKKFALKKINITISDHDVYSTSYDEMVESNKAIAEKYKNEANIYGPIVRNAYINFEKSNRSLNNLLKRGYINAGGFIETENKDMKIYASHSYPDANTVAFAVIAAILPYDKELYEKLGLTNCKNDVDKLSEYFKKNVENKEIFNQIKLNLAKSLELKINKFEEIKNFEQLGNSFFERINGIESLSDIFKEIRESMGIVGGGDIVKDGITQISASEALDLFSTITNATHNLIINEIKTCTCKNYDNKLINMLTFRDGMEERGVPFINGSQLPAIPLSGIKEENIYFATGHFPANLTKKNEDKLVNNLGNDWGASYGGNKAGDNLTRVLVQEIRVDENNNFVAGVFNPIAIETDKNRKANNVKTIDSIKIHGENCKFKNYRTILDIKKEPTTIEELKNEVAAVYGTNDENMENDLNYYICRALYSGDDTENVKQDKNKAIRLIKLAVDNGYTYAMRYYALILQNDKDIGINKEESLKYYKKYYEKTKDESVIETIKDLEKEILQESIIDIKDSEITPETTKEEILKLIIDNENIAKEGYKVGDKLGEGSYGAVFKMGDGRAIKITEFEEKDYAEEFANEEKVSSMINPLGSGFGKTLKSHRVKIGDRYFLVEISKERLTDLDKVIEGQPTITDFSPMAGAIQLVNALEKAHLNGMILADIKPLNIFVNKNGVCKLADFGFTGKAEEYKNSYGIGTPAYQAPEIRKEYREDEDNSGKINYLTQKADVYALGVTLSEMFTGDRALNIDDINLAKLYPNIDFTKNSELENTLKEKIYYLIKAMTEEDIDKRPTIFEVKEKLAELAEYVSKNGIDLKKDLKVRNKDLYGLGLTNKTNLKEIENKYKEELELLISGNKKDNIHLQTVLGDKIDKLSDNAIACLNILKNGKLENFNESFDNIIDEREKLIVAKRLLDFKKLQLAKQSDRIEEFRMESLTSIINKNPEMIEYLFVLDLKADEKDTLETKEQWYQKLFEKALERNDGFAIKFLLNTKIGKSIEGENLNNYFKAFCKYGDVKIVKDLLSNENLSEEAVKEGFVLACENGNDGILKELLNKKEGILNIEYIKSYLNENIAGIKNKEIFEILTKEINEENIIKDYFDKYTEVKKGDVYQGNPVIINLFLGKDYIKNDIENIKKVIYLYSDGLNLETFEYLFKKEELFNDEKCAKIIFNYYCENGKLDDIGNCIEKIKGENEREEIIKNGFTEACDYKKFEVVQFLLNEYDFVKDKLNSLILFNFKKKNFNLETVNFLIEIGGKFGTKEDIELNKSIFSPIKNNLQLIYGGYSEEIKDKLNEIIEELNRIEPGRNKKYNLSTKNLENINGLLDDIRKEIAEKKAKGREVVGGSGGDGGKLGGGLKEDDVKVTPIVQVAADDEETPPTVEPSNVKPMPTEPTSIKPTTNINPEPESENDKNNNPKKEDKPEIELKEEEDEPEIGPVTPVEPKTTITTEQQQKQEILKTRVEHYEKKVENLNNSNKTIKSAQKSSKSNNESTINNITSKIEEEGRKSDKEFDKIAKEAEITTKELLANKEFREATLADVGIENEDGTIKNYEKGFGGTVTYYNDGKVEISFKEDGFLMEQLVRMNLGTEYNDVINILKKGIVIENLKDKEEQLKNFFIKIKTNPAKAYIELCKNKDITINVDNDTNDKIKGAFAIATDTRKALDCINYVSKRLDGILDNNYKKLANILIKESMNIIRTGEVSEELRNSIVTSGNDKDMITILKHSTELLYAIENQNKDLNEINNAIEKKDIEEQRAKLAEICKNPSLTSFAKFLNGEKLKDLRRANKILNRLDRKEIIATL